MTWDVRSKLEDLAAVSHSFAAAVTANDLELAGSLLERRGKLLRDVAEAGHGPSVVDAASESVERARAALATRRENLRDQLASARKARQAREALKPASSVVR